MLNCFRANSTDNLRTVAKSVLGMQNFLVCFQAIVTKSASVHSYTSVFVINFAANTSNRKITSVMSVVLRGHGAIIW